jgi:hypothetical protein
MMQVFKPLKNICNALILRAKKKYMLTLDTFEELYKMLKNRSVDHNRDHNFEPTVILLHVN